MGQQWEVKLKIKPRYLQPIGLFAKRSFIKNEAFPDLVTRARTAFCFGEVESFKKDFGKRYAAWTRKSSFDFLSTLWLDVPIWKIPFARDELTVAVTFPTDQKSSYVTMNFEIVEGGVTYAKATHLVVFVSLPKNRPISWRKLPEVERAVQSKIEI